MRLCALLTSSRDGKDADEKVKQILDIAPILPGQKADTRFEIPKSHESNASNLSDKTLPKTKQEQNGAQSQSFSDELIDFGQNEEFSKQPQPPNNTQNNYQSSIEAAPPVQKPPPQQQHDLLGGDIDDQMSGYNDNTSNLQPTLQPTVQPQPQSHPHVHDKLSGSVKRLDSSSNAVDEFHDALG